MSPIPVLSLTSLVIRICQHEEDILQDRNIELLEEDARRLLVSLLHHIVYQFHAHAETSVLNFAVVVLTCPHASINHEFELATVQFQKRRETVQIDGLKQFEEFDSVQRVLRKVLVDHFERAFEDVFHDSRDLIRHETLFTVSTIQQGPRKTNLTDCFELQLVQRTFSLLMTVVITSKTSASRAPGTFLL